MNASEIMNDLPQGAGSRLDADTLRKHRPGDFVVLGGSTNDNLYYLTVTVAPGAILAGATATAAVTWATAFSSTPRAWLGEIVSGSNFAKMVLSLSSVSTSGGTITVFNPTAGSITPNFTMTVYGLGKI